MTDNNDRTTERPRSFLDLHGLEESAPDEPNSSTTVRTPRRSTKGERYEITRIEKCISRRIRRDRTGKPSYDVQVFVDGRAMSKTFSRLRDARRFRDEALGDRATGRMKIPADRRITVDQFVRSDWFTWLNEQVRFGNLKPTTVEWYKGGSRRLVSEIGRVKLANVGKNELRGMLDRRITAGDSDSVVRQLRASTRSVLSLAIDRDILMSDPSGFMTGKNAPRPFQRSVKEFKAWSASEAQAFLRHVEGDRLEALWILLLGSGLRRGEALGLQWKDIDLNERTVSVRRSLGLLNCVPTMSSPKTRKSTRVISVGSSVSDALRDHRYRQAQERLAAEAWGTDEGFVFTTATGEWLRPDYVTRRFKKLVADAELPWIRLHGTRHTMASIALQNGTDIATVSERLGHENTRVTAEIYLHGSKESDREAANALDAVLHG